MPANTVPVFPSGPLVGKALPVAANTNYAVPTAALQLIPGQTNGARIVRVNCVPAATCVATDVQLYGYDGTTYRFIRAVAMPATTISAGNTAAITPVDFGYSDTSPLYLGANEQLMTAISVANASGISVRAEGGPY
jgi:hypothetical protein